MRPRVVVALAWVGLVLYAYPGFMSYDSVEQLAQARAGVYGDWHPPAMAALWRVVELVVRGPLGMLLLQTAAFATGAYLILRRTLTDRAAAWCTLALLWFPPIGTVLAVIWKDSQMAGYALLGFALMLDRPSAPRRGAARSGEAGACRGRRLTGLALLALATAMRHNAFTLTLPLVVVAWAPSPRRWRRLGLALAAWAGITAAAELANAALTDTAEHPWQRSVALMDIGGTLRWAEPIDDAELRASLAGVRLRVADGIQWRAAAAYDPGWMWREILDRSGTFARPARGEAPAITRAWRDVVGSHPGAYLRYRWDVFAELLALPPRQPPGAVWVWFGDGSAPSADDIEHDAAASRVQDAMRGGTVALGTGWLFRPWMYLVLAAALIPLAWRDRVARALLASAVLSELPLYVAAPTPDYRYSVWLVVATLLVALPLAARRWRRA